MGVCGVQAEETGDLRHSGARKNPVAFSQIHSHQEGILIDKTESDKGDPMHLTNRNKGKKSEQAARAPRNA